MHITTDHNSHVYLYIPKIREQLNNYDAYILSNTIYIVCTHTHTYINTEKHPLYIKWKSKLKNKMYSMSPLFKKHTHVYVYVYFYTC